MSSAAQVTAPRSRTRLSPRSAARLRRMTLRGAAIVYLGAMVALPVAAVITKGFGDGLEGLRTALNVPGGMAAIRLTLDHLDAGVDHQRGDGHDARLRARSLSRSPAGGRCPPIVDLPLAIPTLVTGVMLVALYGPNSPIGGFLDGLGIQVIFTPIAIMLALLVVTLAAGGPQRAARAPGARHLGRRGGGHAGCQRVDHVLPGRVARDPARDRGRHAAHLRPVPGRVRQRRARGRQRSQQDADGAGVHLPAREPVPSRSRPRPWPPCCSPSRSCWCS